MGGFLYPIELQCVPPSGVREALLAPMAAPALLDAVRSSLVARQSVAKRGRAPRHMEQSFHPPLGGSRACRTPADLSMRQVQSLQALE